MCKRVVVGLSGGVDSAVTAYLLKEQGYEVIGLFMRNWREEKEGFCTAEEDFSDVRRIADTLGIRYYSVDFSEEYLVKVFKLFVEEYREGRTPNPDVLCNSEIKFQYFREYAEGAGADYIATGHYADIEHRNGLNYLMRARDENKDQTYFLNQVTNKQLDNVLFPLGGLIKPEVRAIAEKAGIPVAKKKDSTGICFIGERKFREFLSSYLPMKKGEIKTLDGKTVGEHDGVFYYTAGQRRGLGIGGKKEGAGDRWFVIKRDVKNNILYVSEGECGELFSDKLGLESFNFIPVKLEADRIPCMTRIRHRQPLQEAELIKSESGYTLEFKEPQRAAAEGQYAVCYRGRYCIGGGKINKVY
jgi:tRNA-specific 2-thiouridylase